MKSQNTTQTPSAVVDLQEKWPKLNALDCARSVHQIHKSGISLRALAKALKCSPSLLRHLNQAAQAPVLDQLLAGNGKISTRELARRSKSSKAQQVAKERERLEAKRTEAAQQGSRTICDWLGEEKLWTSHGEAIVNEARMILFGAEQHGTLPQGLPPSPDTPVEEIIRRCRPKPDTEESSDVARYAHWLAVWAFYAFPDTVVRDRALNLALDKQIRG